MSNLLVPFASEMLVEEVAVNMTIALKVDQHHERISRLWVLPVALESIVHPAHEPTVVVFFLPLIRTLVLLASVIHPVHEPPYVLRIRLSSA